MIKYPITQQQLEGLVDAHDPNWRGKADARTANFRAAKCYNEADGIWGDIKEVYITLQNSKCAYCEQMLEPPPLGPIQHDVEHYRPKNAVKKWPPKRWPPKAPATARTLKYGFATGDAWPEGYYLLAYKVLNYATACKVCNTILKSSYFPIYGSRGPQSDDCRALRSEQPLLIFPVGDIDDDPEDLITFNGTLPIEKVKSGLKSYRARVTIDFFALDRRELLQWERSQQIFLVWTALDKAETEPNPADRQLFADAAAVLLSPASPHTNCARAFHRLYQAERPAARAVAMAALDYIASKKPRR
jgi:hypothetical protein